MSFHCTDCAQKDLRIDQLQELIQSMAKSADVLMSQIKDPIDIAPSPGRSEGNVVIANFRSSKRSRRRSNRQPNFNPAA